MMLTTTIYKCAFCNKTYKTLKGYEKHSCNCNKNPDRHMCGSCIHFGEYSTTIYLDDWNASYSKIIKRCFKFSKDTLPDNTCKNYEQRK